MNTQQLLSQVMTEDDAFYYSLYTRTLCCTLCHYRGTVKVYMNWCAVVQSVGVERIAPAAPLKFQEPLCSTRQVYIIMSLLFRAIWLALYA